MVEQLGNIRWASFALKVHHLFAPKAKVWVKCWGCPHQQQIDPLWLATYGPNESLQHIEAKLKCTKCGMRGWAKMKIEWTL
jgi:hypothetical protein